MSFVTAVLTEPVIPSVQWLFSFFRVANTVHGNNALAVGLEGKGRRDFAVEQENQPGLAVDGSYYACPATGLTSATQKQASNAIRPMEDILSRRFLCHLRRR